MTRLRVTPEHRHGRDRWFVSLPDGTGIAWYDKDEHRVSLIQAARHDEVLAALAPYLTGEVTVGPPPPPTPEHLDRLSLHPDDDLAPNRPGEALHAELAALPGTLAQRFRHDPRDTELRAQQTVGEQAERLEGVGWHVLHSIPLPGARARIDHLAIGPAGVLAIRALPARHRRVRINDPLVRTGRAAPAPYLRQVRQAAALASLALATSVVPVLAVVEAARLDVLPVPQDVRILHDTEIAALADLDGVLKPADIESLYATARDRRSWQRV